MSERNREERFKVIKESELSVYQLASAAFDVEVSISKEEGEDYIHKSIDMWGDGKVREVPYVVPEGSVYVRFEGDPLEISSVIDLASAKTWVL